MSIGVLATSEPANSAIAARGTKKAAHDGEGPFSGFKDLIGDNKSGQKAASDTAASEQGMPSWRHFGLQLESGEAATPKADAGEDAAILVQDGIDPDAPAVDAEAVATTVVPAVEVTPLETEAKTDAALVGETPAKPAAAPLSTTATAQLATAAVGQNPDVLQVNASAQGEISLAQAALAADSTKGKTQVQSGLAISVQNAVQAGTLKPENAQGKAPARGEIANIIQNNTQAAALQPQEARPETSGNGAENGQQNQGRGNQGDAEIQNLAQIAGSKPASNVSVISNQIAPAPVQALPISETGSAFATSLAAEVLSRDRADPATQTTLTQNFGKAAPITTLKIQLHPAELGMVTARLSGSESQLSIAITVDNAEARHKLTADADAIISALKGMGIDVDRVTIQQQQPGSGASANGDGRGSEFRQSGESRGDGQGQSSRQGSESDNGENLQRSQATERADAAGDGVYI